MRPLHKLSLAFFAFWTACALLSSLAVWTQVQLGHVQIRDVEPRFLDVLRLQGNPWIAAALLTPVVGLWTVRLARSGWLVIAGAHLAGLLLFVWASTLIGINVGLLLRGHPPQWPTAPTLLGRAAGSLALLVTEYAVIVGITLAVSATLEAHQRAIDADRLDRAKDRLEQDLTSARLLVLRQQLQPHFLFNALNAVSGLIETDPVAARRTLARIGDLLRLSLDRSTAPEATLGEELDFVDRYLDVERARLGDRLQVRYDVPAALLSVRLPSFALQPLVENAVRHGVAMLPGGGRIDISVSRAPRSLEVRIANDVPQPVGLRPDGIGLGTLRARLAGLYGHLGQLTAGSRPDGRFEVLLQIPAVTEDAS